MSLKLIPAIVLLPALFGFVGGAIAETKATLHSGVKGRAGVDRNRLILSNTMPDGRDVMLVIGCRANEHDALAIAVDFRGWCRLEDRRRRRNRCTYACRCNDASHVDE